jgi:hypothetical protein
MIRPPAGSWVLWRPELHLRDERLLDWDTAWSGLRLPKNWSPVGQGRIGSIRIAALFVEWDRELARQILSNDVIDWRGDRLWSAQIENGPHAFVWALQFRTVRAAKLFSRAWWSVRGLQKNLPVSSLSEGESTGEGMMRESPLRVIRLEQERERVWIADGFPEELSARVLQSVRKIPVRER